MGLHYCGGIGTVYDKELEKSIGSVDYQMIETDATKYTRKRWWGEFYSNRKIKKTGVYRLELEDGRGGD